MFMFLGIQINISRRQANRFIAGMEQQGFVAEKTENGRFVNFRYNGVMDINHEIYFTQPGEDHYPNCVMKVRPTAPNKIEI